MLKDPMILVGLAKELVCNFGHKEKLNRQKVETKKKKHKIAVFMF